jgi:hypothetical protein
MRAQSTHRHGSCGYGGGVVGPSVRGLLAVLGALAAAPCCAGDGWGVGLGATDEIEGESTPVLLVSWMGAARHPWEFSAGYLGGRDGTQRTPATVFVAMSKRLTWRGWFVSGGIAVNDRDGAAISGHGQFYTGAGYAGNRWALSLRHLSNADTGGENRGETFVLLEYRF